MKKGLSIFCVIGLLMLTASPLYAGGIINKQNQSADYMRTLNRHAATDYADIAVYNPAGIMKMADGGYAKLDVMYFAKDYSNTVPNGTFVPPPPASAFFQGFNNADAYGELDQDEPSVIPGAFAVYKQKKWGIFGAFSIPAGGGELDYDKGSARTVRLASGVATQANFDFGLTPPNSYDLLDAQNIKVKESTVYGLTLGGTFAFNEQWSIAAGVRYANGTREFEGSATISSTTLTPAGLAPPVTANLNIESDADGWAGILGVNFAPNDKINTALTYISNTKMDYTIKVKEDNLGLAPQIGFADGSSQRIDIPALLGFGISYKFMPQLKVDFNAVYYFEDSAEIDTFTDEGDSYDLGLAAEYAFSEQWKASLGYLHTKIKLDDDQQINEPEEPKLSANTLGAGAVWSPSKTWAITFGGAYVMYDDVTDSQGIKYEKSVWNLSAGVQWKFL
jgi:long-chain fatty acid transport protein